MQSRLRSVCVAVFAIAMAWVEAAVVLYLRVLVNRLQPYQPDPLPRFGGLGQAELIREGATLLMLLAVGWLAGERLRTRLAYSAFAFGVWDIFYYLFLIPLTGWPHSLLDWDLLFLFPVPWWGPVIAPVAISLLMIMGGMLVIWIGDRARPACLRAGFLAAGVIGVGLMFWAFTADAFAVLGRGAEVVREVLPSAFHWGVFLPGWLLMTASVAAMTIQAASFSRKGTVVS